MTSLPGNTPEQGTTQARGRTGATEPSARAATSRLERVHALLAADAAPYAQPLLRAARIRADRVRETAAGEDAADRLAAYVFAGDVVAALAAEGELDAVAARATAASLADACADPLAAATLDLYLRTVTSPLLRELPPIVAVEIQVRLLLHLSVATEVSVWRRTAGRLECLLCLGADVTSRRVRAEAKAAVGGRQPLSLLGRSMLRSATVLRFGQPHAALVVRVSGTGPGELTAFLEEAATALAPVLERELLLERSAERERALVSSGEKRLLRLGFDLHDGPVQDVLALGADVGLLRGQVNPLVPESHRELVLGRFDDLLARVTELDRGLREIAHSLESKSIVSRPLGEILHREVDAFAERSSVAAHLEVRGDPESLSPSQRIAVFRAVQEALANVREHSGASSVEVQVRARRSSVDVRITDDGHGFEVSRALARAAQRGRLGLVGIGERVRLLGGTFELESRPGGPTTLRFSLPRWEPPAQAPG